MNFHRLPNYCFKPTSRYRKLYPKSLALVIAVLAITSVSTQPLAAAPAIEPLILSAQNFHIYTSGNLRFVFGIPSDILTNRLTNNRNAQFRISLGQRLTKGDQQVRDIFNKTEPFNVVDTIDIPVRDATRRIDGQFEIIGLSTDRETGTNRLEFDGPGIYPVQIEAIINNQPRASVTTFVNRYDPSNLLGPLPLSVIVALDAPITLQSNNTYHIDQTTREKLMSLIDLLGPDGEHLSIQISPELIQGLSRSTDQIDQTLLVQLLTLLSKTAMIDTTFVPLDVSRAKVTRQEKLFASLLNTSQLLRKNLFSTTRTAPKTWISRSTIDQNGIDLIVENGIRSLVLLPDANSSLSKIDNPTRPFRLTSGGIDLNLFLTADQYVKQLTDPANNSFVAATCLAAQILAQRNKIESDGGTPALHRIVLTSKDGSATNKTLIHELLLILARVPQQISIEQLTNLPDPRKDAEIPTLVPIKTADFANRINDIAALRIDLSKLNSSIDVGDEIWSQWDDRLTVMLSDTMTATQREVLRVATRNELKEIRQSVTLQEGTTFTLGSRESQLRLNLQNASNHMMTVQVQVASNKLRFAKPAAIIKVPANGSSELVVDVIALSNGLFPVSVRIFTADGLSQLGKKVEVSARVNALAGSGQVVTGVGLLLLVVWWAAHIRRKFRKRISKHHPVLRSQS